MRTPDRQVGRTAVTQGSPPLVTEIEEGANTLESELRGKGVCASPFVLSVIPSYKYDLV